MQRGSTLRGVFVLMVAMMMIAAGSAHMAVVDFEDASLSEGDMVEHWGAVHQYLKITPWAESEGADALIVVDSGDIKAYQGGSGAAPGANINNLCLKDPDNLAADQGLGSAFAIPDVPDSTWTFEFMEGIYVEDFGIDMLDYGDWFPYDSNSGEHTATLTAYDASGTAIAWDTFVAGNLSAAKYDACGTDGIQRLEVVAPFGEFIAYAEITFDAVDTGIAFDNIEFNYLCALPVEYDLIAGQHDDVGTVLVWDDGDSIFVKYLMDELGPWMIEEIHLAVGWTEGDIPQTKKFNPIPGQFPTKEYFDPLTMVAGEYEIPFEEVLGDGNDGNVVIAAHAVVWNTDTEVTVTAGFYSDGVGDGGTTLVTAGNVNVPEVPDYPYLAVDAWEHSTWNARLVVDSPDYDVPFAFDKADWIWESNRTVDPLVSQDVVFKHSFDVADTYGYPTSPLVGEVSIADDNMYSADMNGIFLGAQTVYGDWMRVGTYGFAPLVGENVLNIVGTNYGASGYNIDNNPAGLIFEGSYSYDTYEWEETAWGSDGTCEFDGKNWALCGEYTIGVCPPPLPLFDLLWTGEVSGESLYPGGTESGISLVAGREYVLKASGTYKFADWQPAGIADAQCSYRSADYVSIPPGYPLDSNNAAWVPGDFNSQPNGLEVIMDSTVIDWTPVTCAASHEYSVGIVGAGDTVLFQIRDSWYADNAGLITVEIWGYGF